MKIDKLYSIRFKFILLCFLTIIICIALNSTLFNFTKRVINTYFIKQQEITNNYLNDLKTYVQTNNIKLNDLEKLNNWLEDKDDLVLRIYHNDNLSFDYGFKNDNKLTYSNKDDGENIYTLRLADTELKVGLVYNNETLDDNIRLIVLFISLLVTFGIIFYQIEEKLRYIEELNKDIKKLSKDLSHEIKITDCDEISNMAMIIDGFRKEIKERINNEKKIYNTNLKLVTTLAHDIKTPLTSILGYVELAREEKIDNEDLRRYLRIIHDKSLYLKDLSNDLLSVFMLHVNEHKIPLEKLNAGILIGQILEDKILEFEKNNYIFKREYANINCDIKVNTVLFKSLFDNLFSNIEKYANSSKEILIKYYLEKGELKVIIKNYKQRIVKDNLTSTKIGLENCKAIMRKHGGDLKVREDDYYFEVELLLLPT